MTSKEKYDLICKKLNLKEYYDNKYEGQNIKICNMESNIKEQDEHGWQVYSTLLTYAPMCEVYSFKDETGKSGIGHILEMVEWCIDNDIDIIVSSLDWMCDEEEEKEAIEKAYENGIIFCNCAGNNNHKITLGKSSKASCIDVGVVAVSSVGLDYKGKFYWADENYGNAVDVVSIGEKLPVAYEFDKLKEDYSYMTLNGTSFATPMFVSMLAVLMSSGKIIDSKNVMEYIENYSETFAEDGMNYNLFVMPPLVPFDDIEEDEISFYEEPSKWAEKSWKKAYEKGVLDGSNPQGNMTREMFAVVLDRLGFLD